MSDLHDEGMKTRREVLGDEHVDRAIEATTPFTAAFQDLITRYAWGEIWSRPGLDRRTRSCITLTALIALGHERELAMHVRAALRNGVTPAEIEEVILQSAIYCGVPAANSAFAIAQRVVEEESGGRAGRRWESSAAGPSGLLLSHLLHLEGIESVVLEDRTQEYVISRVRAGVLEQGVVNLLRAVGLGARIDAEGLVHDGIEIRFGGRRHRIDFKELIGRTIMIYGQNKVIEDLIAIREDAGGDLRYEVADVTLDDLETTSPSIRFRHDGRDEVIECDFVVGCDGFHGVSRPSIPDGALTVFERVYAFGWLGILAEVAPSTEEVSYAHHERGFALHSMRSPTVSRLYIQVPADDDIADWPDDRIWAELHARLAVDDGWELEEGPVIEKGIAPLRSFVAEPMRHGQLFLAGDAAHIVPPTGAKGLNLAVADVTVLAQALAEYYRSGDESGLDAYSATCLRRVWQAERLSWYLTSMLHLFPENDAFMERLQLAQLDQLVSSSAAATALAESYAGQEIL